MNQKLQASQTVSEEQINAINYKDTDGNVWTAHLFQADVLDSGNWLPKYLSPAYVSINVPQGLTGEE